MKITKYLLIVVLLLALNSCKDKTTNPPDDNNNKQPGYQEDIVWPSLADSPWPMYRGDPQCTGRSKDVGPKAGIIEWSIDTIIPTSALVLTQNSKIVFTQKGYNGSGKVNCFDLEGNTVWYNKLDNTFPLTPSCPIITSDSSILISDPIGKQFKSIKFDGTIKWELSTGEKIIHQTGGNIGKNGIIYVCADNYDYDWYLIAISPAGELLWEEKIDGINGSGLNGMSFSSDGNILYIPGNPYNKSNAINFIAFNIQSRTTEWKFERQGLLWNSAPVVDSKGNLYTVAKGDSGEGRLYSLDKNGNIRWSFYLSDDFYEVYEMNPFALDKNGNVYLGKNRLLSIDYEGKLRWEMEIGNNNRISSPIVIDNTNDIYFSVGTSNWMGKILSVSSEGNLNWEVIVNNINVAYNFSPSIVNGTLIFSSVKSNLIFKLK